MEVKYHPDTELVIQIWVFNEQYTQKLKFGH